MKTRVLVLTGLFVITTMVPASAQVLPPHAPGEVLMAFKKEVSDAKARSVLKRVKARLIRRLGLQRPGRAREVPIEHLAVSVPVSRALDILQNDPSVAFVEPNYLMTHQETADDTYYTNGSLWGMFGDDVPVCGPVNTTNPFGVDAEEAWSLGYIGSSDVYVGVVDEGAQLSHPDLAQNIWTNPYDPADGIDNDGNGKIDDVHGWDFFNGDNSVYDSADGDAHGTHVSGTIGAVGGNGIGVAGVAWNINVIPAKFLGPQGGYLSDAVAALDYLRDLKQRHGLRIVASSNSWGGGSYSSSLHTAILRAAKEGILFIAAAGNSGTSNDLKASYPSNYSTLQGSSIESAASYEAVIAVAAINSSGSRASFSNYGVTTVDLGAPGVGIWSSVPTNSYASYSGTSMATPHVSGAAALYASVFPAATAKQIRQAILLAVKPTSSLAGITVTGGRLSLAGMFQFPPPEPTPIVDVAVTSISARSWVKRLRSTTVSIVVTNQGNQTATFTVSLSASGGIVGAPRSVTLAPRGAQTVGISWIAPSTQGNYTLTGRASALSGETDTTDNELSRTITVR